jgi:hypothetical protein
MSRYATFNSVHETLCNSDPQLRLARKLAHLLALT